MAEDKPDSNTGTCFVVMGFGKKTDFESGRTLDLDKSYKNMIKPAVEAAGLKCIRADEIVHSGLIDVPMYEQLLNADVVVADLSTSNKNAFYELGVRHALRPFTTVVIAEDGIKTFPFDVNHVAIQKYHHLGEDIGFEEVMRFRQLLSEAIVKIQQVSPRAKDSPVYTFLNGLNPPALAAVLQAAAETAATVKENAKDAGIGNAPPVKDTAPDAATHSMLMQQVDEAQKKGDFITAKSLLSIVRNMMKPQGSDKAEDPYILQRLALTTYKSKFPTEEAALKEAKDLLSSLNPDTSNDPETLGLWGSVHKRLFELTKDTSSLDEAVRAYERGFYLKNDYYNGINMAFLLNVRASVSSDAAEAIADFIQARRIRNEVLQICSKLLEPVSKTNSPEGSSLPAAENLNDRYWVLATLAEAYTGLEDEANAQQTLEQAYSIPPAPWMKASTDEQIAKLKQLLQDSPLKFLKSVGSPA